MKPEAVLAALFHRLPFARYNGSCKEVFFALHIRDILSLKSRGWKVIIPDLMLGQDSSPGVGEPSGDDELNGGGGGTGGGSEGPSCGGSGPSGGGKPCE